MLFKKAVLATLLVGLLAGCDKPKEGAQSNVVPSVDAASLQSTGSEVQGDIAGKANIWLAVFQNESQLSHLQNESGGGSVTLSDVVRNQLSSAKSYFEKVEKNDLFSGKKTITEKEFVDAWGFGMKLDSDRQNTYLYVSKALAEKKPALPELDKAGQDYINSVIAFSNVVNAMSDYRFSGEYKLDRLQKAPELHAALVKAYGDYLLASKRASVAYDHVYQELHVKELAYFKEQGAVGLVAAIEGTDTFEDVSNELFTAYREKGSLKGLSADVYQERIQKLDDVLATVKALQGDKKALAKSGLNPIYIDRYVDELSAAIIQLKLTIRDMGQSDTKDRSLLDSLNQKQNQLIDKYNDVIN